MKMLKIFLIFTLYSIGLRSEVMFYAEIESYGLPYLPVYLNFTIDNKTDKSIKVPANAGFLRSYDLLKVEVRGEVDYDCKVIIAGQKSGIVETEELAIGEKKRYRIDISRDYGIINPGVYEVKVTFNTEDSKWDLRGSIRARWESGWINVEIKEPVGEDELLIEELKKIYPLIKEKDNAEKLLQSYKCKLIDIIEVKDLILEKFLTSTYAGWVLKDTYSGALLSFKNVKDYITELKLSFEEKKKKWISERGGRATDKGWIDPLPIAKDYIERAEKFIKHHPNFGRADVIYFKLFLAYLVTNEWEKAYEAGKNVEGDFPYEWAIYESNFKEVMKELKDQGLVNEKK